MRLSQVEMGVAIVTNDTRWFSILGKAFLHYVGI